MYPNQIVEEIRQATEEVFTMMLGLEVVPGEAVAEQAAPGPTEGVVSLIGLAGPWVGTGSISCSASTACYLSSKFLMTEFASVNEDVLDSIAELTNMIIGSFKTRAEERLGPMGLSIPTVIFGRNFTTRTVSRNDWTMVPFTVDDNKFDVHICLTPNDKQPHMRPRANDVGAPMAS
jgi:chemotaxis protein CheX